MNQQRHMQAQQQQQYQYHQQLRMQQMSNQQQHQKELAEYKAHHDKELQEHAAQEKKMRELLENMSKQMENLQCSMSTQQKQQQQDPKVIFGYQSHNASGTGTTIGEGVEYDPRNDAVHAAMPDLSAYYPPVPIVNEESPYSPNNLDKMGCL
jgi:hypothetical protein